MDKYLEKNAKIMLIIEVIGTMSKSLASKKQKKKDVKKVKESVLLDKLSQGEKLNNQEDLLLFVMEAPKFHLREN